MNLLFKKTDELIYKIDQFIDLAREASLHFQKALFLLLDNKMDEFEVSFEIIVKIENEADELKKDIEAKLYSQMLIPESRGDVLLLIESIDHIINGTKHIMKEMSIEHPYIPDNIVSGIKELAVSVDSTINFLILTVRSYFNNISAIKNTLHLVKFHEKEADDLSEKIKRDIFALDADLSNKLQLRDIISNIDGLADMALSVSNLISIAAIKLTL